MAQWLIAVGADDVQAHGVLHLLTGPSARGDNLSKACFL